jgi:hypothetical protein
MPVITAVALVQLCTLILGIAGLLNQRDQLDPAQRARGRKQMWISFVLMGVILLGSVAQTLNEEVEQARRDAAGMRAERARREHEDSLTAQRRRAEIAILDRLAEQLGLATSLRTSLDTAAVKLESAHEDILASAQEARRRAVMEAAELQRVVTSFDDLSFTSLTWRVPNESRELREYLDTLRSMPPAYLAPFALDLPARLHPFVRFQDTTITVPPVQATILTIVKAGSADCSAELAASQPLGDIAFLAAPQRDQARWQYISIPAGDDFLYNVWRDPDVNVVRSSSRIVSFADLDGACAMLYVPTERYAAHMTAVELAQQQVLSRLYHTFDLSSVELEANGRRISIRGWTYSRELQSWVTTIRADPT